MWRFNLVLLLLSVSILPSHAFQAGNGTSPASAPQKGDAQSAEQESTFELQRLVILSDLKALAADLPKLQEPLARARASAEIADAAWLLDQEWAKSLLSQAYTLTFPSQDEGNRLLNQPPGAQRQFPTRLEQARHELRSRIFTVASRDRTFAAQLLKLGTGQVGRYEEHQVYESMANIALGNGDRPAAIEFISKSIEADPTSIGVGGFVNNLALQDRSTADKFILQYLDTLQSFPLSRRDLSLGRVMFALTEMIYPGSLFPDPAKNRATPPGPAVMRAYVSFVLASLGQLEQREPGSLKSGRRFLLSVWLPLREYAPELTGEFMALERLSRGPNQNADLPTQASMERDKERIQEGMKRDLESDSPSDRAIKYFLNNDDFPAARKAIDKLPDGEPKTQLIEIANWKEAISLALKGDISAAAILAERLNKAASIHQVYPLLVQKCAAKKDGACSRNLVYQAVKQLKKADTAPFTPPPGIPAVFDTTGRDFDVGLKLLTKLAEIVAPLDGDTALELLNEIVAAANKSSIDTGQGRTGFDSRVFKSLAALDETRVEQATYNIENPLQRIVARAAILQSKAEELDRAEKKKMKPRAEGT